MDSQTLFYVETLPNLASVFGNVNLCTYQTLDLAHFCKINGATLTLYNYAGNLLWSVTKSGYNLVSASPKPDNTPLPVLRNVYISGDIMYVVIVPGNGTITIDKWLNGALVFTETYSGPPHISLPSFYLLTIAVVNGTFNILIGVEYYNLKSQFTYGLYEAVSGIYFFNGPRLNATYRVGASVLVNNNLMCVFFTNIMYQLNVTLMTGQFYDLLSNLITLPFSSNSAFCGSFFGAISTQNEMTVLNSYSSMPLLFGLFNLIALPVIFPISFNVAGIEILTAGAYVAGGFFIEGYPSYFLQIGGVYYLFQPKISLTQYKMQRHYAYNYSRGVPINQGTQNLILPPNRNIIL